MKTWYLLAILAVLALFGAAQPASAQVIPDVRGLQPYTAQTNFMSLPGYLRWQYYTENNVWIAWNEAVALASAQTNQPLFAS